MSKATRGRLGRCIGRFMQPEDTSLTKKLNFFPRKFNDWSNRPVAQIQLLACKYRQHQWRRFLPHALSVKPERTTLSRARWLFSWPDTHETESCAPWPSLPGSWQWLDAPKPYRGLDL